VEAWEQSGIHPGDIDPSCIGVFAGTSRGPVNKRAEASKRLRGKRFFPSLAAASTISSVSGALAQYFSVTGSAVTTSAACASATLAMIQGAQELLLGKLDAVLVGGTEAPMEPTVVRCLKEAGVVAHGADPTSLCRPFYKDRIGLILGEGAGFLVMEKFSRVRSRNAVVLAAFTGWNTGNDIAGRVGLTEIGEHLSRVLDRALARAGLVPANIGWINAHGTGTPLNDLVESRAIHGSGLSGVPVSSTKPITGHCVGAPGGRSGLGWMHSKSRLRVRRMGVMLKGNS